MLQKAICIECLTQQPDQEFGGWDSNRDEEWKKLGEVSCSNYSGIVLTSDDPPESCFFWLEQMFLGQDA